MAFDDVFGSGQDQLRDSLLSQYQPDDGQPYSANPQILVDRLARKLAIRPTKDADVDFNVAPEKESKGPDLSSFGTPVKDEAAPAPSTDDLSGFGTKVEPEGPSQPPLTISRQGAAALKGIPHGAISTVGGIMKGAGLASSKDTMSPSVQSAAAGLDPANEWALPGERPNPEAPSPGNPMRDALIKGGKATQDFADNLAYPGMPGQPNIIDPMSPAEKESIGGRIGTGAGAIAPYAITTLLAGPLAGIGAGAAGMATDTYGSVFEAAKAAGKTDEEAAATASKSALVAGVLGGLPFGASHLGKAPIIGSTLKPYLDTLIGKIAASSATFATLGEAQEAILQQIAKDYDPKAGYTFDQKRLIAELILGAGMGGLHHAFERKPDEVRIDTHDDRTGARPDAGLPPPAGPSPGDQPGAGPGPQQPGAGPQPGGDAGSTGAGPNPGTGGPGAGQRQQPPPGGQQQGPTPGSGPGKPPPGTGEGKGPDFKMDARMRAKFEKLYRTFGGDPAGMADHELFNALNDQMRDTSSTGHTAKPETPEEATAREATAAERTERDELIKRGWDASWVNSMTPEQRQKALKTGRSKAGAASGKRPEAGDTTAQENTTKQPGTATTSSPDKVVPASDSDVVNPTPGTRAAPIKAETSSDILDALPAEPKSPEQAQAENYKHAHVEIDHLGLTGRNSISIETGVGQERKGIDPDGKEWSVTMPVAYGRIKGTKGADGQPLDIFIGPQPTSPHVFVVDQHHANGGGFDEHKILAGFPGPDAALRAYADAYTDKGGDRIGHVTAMTPDEFKQWLKGDTSVALKKGLPPGKTGRNVGDPTPQNAAAPESHHTPEAALTNPESHHTPEPASKGQNQTVTRGGTPEPSGLSLGLTKPSDSQRVKGAVHKGRTDGDQPVGTGTIARTKNSPAGSTEPQNLLQFIASKGGLKPHPELHVMDAHKHLVNMSGFPPRRKLVKDDGMDLDTAREAAEEAGYFRGSAEGTSTVADFLDAIDDGIRGKHLYAEENEGHRTKRELSAEEERSAYEETRAKEMVDELVASGHGELGPEIKERVLRIMATEGADPDTAVHKALAQLDAQEQLATADEFDDMLGNGAYDEIHTEVPYDDGRQSPREGQDGHGGQEAAPGQPRARAPDRGEDVGQDDEGHDAGRAESADSEPDTSRAAGDQAAGRRAEDPAEADRSFDALGPVERRKAIEAEAGLLFPHTTGKNGERHVTPEHSAFVNGAEGHRWDLALPIHIEFKQVQEAYGLGLQFGRRAPLETVPGDEGMEARIFRNADGKSFNVTLFDTDSGHTMGLVKITNSLPQAQAVARNMVGKKVDYNLDGKTGEMQAGDSDEVVKVKLTRDGPWDFNDTFPTPDPKKLEALDAEGRAPFSMPPTAADVAHQVDASLYDLMGEIGTVREIGEIVAEIKAGKSKIKKLAKIEAELKKLAKDRAEAVQAISDITASIEDVYGRDAAREMMKEARRRIVREERQHDPGVKRPLPEPEKVAPTTETGADNKPQMVLPGAEKASDGTMAKRAAAAPLKPKVAQKAADDGLFGDGHKQTDLLDMAAKKPEHGFTHLYHGTGASNRESIRKHGLLKSKSDDGGIYLTTAKDSEIPSAGIDRWKVDVRGLKLERDETTEAAPGEKWLVHHEGDIPPSRLSLENVPKDAFDDIFDSAIDAEFGPKPDLNIDDVAKGLSALFGKGLKEPEAPFVDEAKYQQALPFFKAGVAHFAAGGADLPTMVRALVRHLSVAGMDADAIRAMKPYIRRFTDDVTAGRETINAPSRSDVLESDRGEPEAGNSVGKADVSPAAGATGQGAGKRGSEADAGDQRPADSGRVSQDHAPAVGANGNLELPAREPVDEGSDATDRQHQRSGADSEKGFSFDDGTADEAVRNAQKDADLNSRRERQRKAEGIEVRPGNISNIAETLPMLFPEQHADVQKAETRFAKPGGHGMLFTNGTGTGKTYSGLGVIKRMAMQGHTNALVVAPSQGILMDWVRSAKDLGLDMKVLDSTVDNGGKGLVGTTYANMGENKHLVDRNWDLVVADEAHKLSSDKDGTTTKALKTLRALTKHPDGLFDRAKMVLRKDWDAIDYLPEASRPAAYAEFQKKATPLINSWKGHKRPKALMMSATPFAYHFSLDYAQGYLFEYDRDKSGGRYNSGDGRDAFFMQHLGYRMRTNKLTKPDADVKSEVMERQLHEHLKKQGSLSGRALTVDKDYDRKFVLAHDAVGQEIDRALNFLQEAEDGRYRPLYDAISKKFDYLTRMRLLEAIKARAAVPYIQQSLDLGRKVVVFHDYNEGGGINPFDLTVSPTEKVTSYKEGKTTEASLLDIYNDFRAQNPYIKDLKFASYLPPIAELTKSFPDALVYNGTVSNKIRNEAKRLFNDDNSGRDIIIVQSAAGEAGISLHDTTGKRQRVLLNLGMPIRPTSSIQQEGRIYRVGQASDAIFRYMNTGTDWERWTFAGKIAERAGTAENLALGDQARTIRQSFVDAFSNAGDYAPEHGEGKGGKETDRALSHSVSEFTKAKTHYFANGKTTGRRDQREGVDYYATPEPVGLKMVEFAGLKPGEKILEPSAGHGAISRYFPEDSARTLVEPSSSLASRAALTSPGARVVVDRFENLDKGANKFDAIVMNPPFGTGGKTAIDHLEKAAGHLKNGGRIVALIPRGSTDGRFDKFMGSPAAKGIYLVGDVQLPAVTFERAGTSISSRIVVLEKQTDAQIARQLQQKSRDYTDVEKIGDLFDRIEHADMGPRLEPVTKDVDIPTEGKITVGGVDFSLESSKRGDIHAANLKSFLGASRFRDVVRAGEANGGEYVKSAKRFDFKTEADRQKFLDAVANPPPEQEAPKAPSGVTFKTGETIHAKTGGKLFVATANERVAGDVYSQMNAVAKANGGYYSSFKGNGAIPGFQFKSAEERQRFLDQMGGGKPDGSGPGGGFASADTDAIMGRLVRDFMAPTASGAGSLGEAGQQHVLQRGRETGVEHLIAYDANGKVVLRNEGVKDRVNVPPEFIALIKDPKNDIVVHHNHPKGSSFSEDDIRMLGGRGLRAVWAHGHDGSVFRAELTPDASKTLPVSPNTALLVLNNTYKEVYSRLMDAISPTVAKRAISATEASFGLLHLVNQALHDAGIIDYRTNFELGDFISRVPGLHNAIDAAVQTARKRVFGDKRPATDDALGKPPAPLRHAGDMGTVFDRAALTAGFREHAVEHPVGRENGGDEEARGEKVAFDGFAAPPNPFQPGGPNSFDNTINDILGRRLLGKLGDLNATEMRVQLQDKFLRVKKAEESVGAPSGLSAYQAESLYYGRTGQRLESLNEHHIDPLIREMKGRDIDLDKLDEFLYARHAPERNNKLGQGYKPGHDFYEAMTDHSKVGASGMSTNEALGVIRAARAAGKLADYLAVARMVDALNARTRRALFDAGLIDRDTFDAWNAGYRYYVPLRGHVEGTEFMGTSSGMNVRGKEAKTAFGRRSKADSPLAYTIMQAEVAIVRAEKNKVGNTFLQFVRANPDPDRWTINRPPLVKRIDPATGLVTSVPDNLYANRDNVFTTKVDGRDVHIALHGPDGLNLARALKNMGTANVHALIRAYSAITHTMAKLATTFNPEFMIPNFARDIGEAFINLQAQEQKAFVRNFVKHIPGAMRGSMVAIAGRTPAPGTKVAKYVDAFHRFDKAGGRIRFFGIDDPDAIETNVNRKLKRLEGSPVNTLKDIGDKAAGALEVAGGGIENATRLAAFMAAENAGLSTADAAMLARNLTVDFNKKGELGGVISGLYMFANAGVQGQARMVRALGSRRVWQAVGALAAAGALSALFSILASDTDEAGVPDYMKIPTWERDKNLIFTLGGHYYLKVPTPYGFSPFAVIGSHSVSVAMGHEKPGKAASSIIDSILSAFNPLGDESTAWMDIVPSAIRPAFHIEFNKNWTGKPLYPERDKNRGQMPDSTQAFKSNSAFSKEAAKELNAWSGGSAYQPGAIDVHPGSIDHILQAVTGGVGRFAKGIADSLYQNLSGGEWQPEKAPILRRFIGKVGPEADNALYYEKRQETLDEKAGVNAARKDLKSGVNTDEAHQFLGETPASKASIFKSADDRIKGLRQQKNLSEPELRDKIREVQNHARAQVQRLQPSQ